MTLNSLRGGRGGDCTVTGRVVFVWFWVELFELDWLISSCLAPAYDCHYDYQGQWLVCMGWALGEFIYRARESGPMWPIDPECTAFFSTCTSMNLPGPIPTRQAPVPQPPTLLPHYPPQSCFQAYQDLPALCMSSCQTPPLPAIHSASLNRISSSWPTAKYLELVDIIKKTARKASVQSEQSRWVVPLCDYTKELRET